MQSSRCNNVLPRVKKNPRRETLLKGVDAVIAAVSSTSVGLPDVEIGHVGGVINPEGPLGLAAVLPMWSGGYGLARLRQRRAVMSYAGDRHPAIQLTMSGKIEARIPSHYCPLAPWRWHAGNTTMKLMASDTAFFVDVPERGFERRPRVTEREHRSIRGSGLEGVHATTKRLKEGKPAIVDKRQGEGK